TVIKEVEVFKETGPVISERVRGMLETGEHISYIMGYNDGTVRPDNPITRAEVAAIFYRLLKDKNVADTASQFTDISGGEWHATAVKTLAALGILAGYEDGAFRPERNITRAEFAAVASRFDEQKSDIDCAFIDVTSAHWAYESILSAYALGWISGYPGDLFLPENAITRAEVVAIVNRMLGRRLRAEDVEDRLRAFYPDLAETHWGFAGMIEASAAHGYEWQSGDWERWAPLN
ncbi:MAG: S-layer homology domain-containing protein, partial [Clostridiales bacterium]|nr:S-layer homology domain-containing protein [Clostridiales bacterium]